MERIYTLEFLGKGGKRFRLMTKRFFRSQNAAYNEAKALIDKGEVDPAMIRVAEFGWSAQETCIDAERGTLNMLGEMG